MTATPSRFFDIAADMSSSGKSLTDIGRYLLSLGATPLDLVRVTIRTEGVDVAEARRLLQAAGLADDADARLTVRVDEGDPWHDDVVKLERGDDRDE